jgi:hypothetical protein
MVRIVNLLISSGEPWVRDETPPFSIFLIELPGEANLTGGSSHEKPDRHTLPDPLCDSWMCGNQLENRIRSSELNKTLTIGIIFAIFSTPAFAQSSSVGEILPTFLPLILLAVIFYLVWKRQKKMRQLEDIRFRNIEDRLDTLENSHR